ncbi:MAG TPA: hypothetical protein VNB64_05100, partial [Solirubrobacteraceae bacterium]|nr:hypothetical protein [Solirubrobacteraceae bacterium]
RPGIQRGTFGVGEAEGWAPAAAGGRRPAAGGGHPPVTRIPASAQPDSSASRRAKACWSWPAP